MNRARLFLGTLLLLLGGALLGEQGYRTLKGQWAGVLLQRAWARSLVSGENERPWAWADLHPIGELQLPDRGESRLVLSGATGQSLAFGVGHVHGTAAVEAAGHCVLAGHRDGSFRVLEHLRPGERVRLRGRAGPWREYRVSEVEVVEEHRVEILDPTPNDQLTLITCYPFGPSRLSGQRWVVRCRPEETEIAALQNSVSSSR